MLGTTHWNVLANTGNNLISGGNKLVSSGIQLVRDGCGGKYKDLLSCGNHLVSCSHNYNVIPTT